MIGIFILILSITQQKIYDTSTYSNLDEFTTIHYELDLFMDFQKKTLKGSNTLTLKSLIDDLESITLDTNSLNVERVVANNQELQFNVDINSKLSKELGQPLLIYLAKKQNQDQEFQIKIYYETSPDAVALNWLEKDQTLGKQAPYLFSQCETISCRSIFPIQDSPAIKSTYKAKIQTNEPNINIFMSANRTKAENGVFEFENKIPYQSYLLAIVAGNVERQQIGERTGVITEPQEIQRCAEELSDLENYLVQVEKYAIEYIWGQYNVVIMPPSFPFGGMENPLLTFASPTIIIGDKSAVNVAIHEIAHSWTGNLVTCENWGSFWLNEGFTVFLERKGLFATSEPKDAQEIVNIASFIGNQTLYQDVQLFGKSSRFTQLNFYVGYVNPDDTFSTIPYEKGYQFLTHIENQIGKEKMQEFMRNYLRQFRFQSINTQDFVNFLDQFIFNNFENSQDILNTINCDKWLNQPGMPEQVLDFKTPGIQKSIQLAHDFIKNVENPFQEEFKNYPPTLKLIFLQHLNHDAKIDIVTLNKINDLYQFNGNKNFDLACEWYQITLKAGFKNNLELIQKYLGTTGRQKFINNVYIELVKVDSQLAKETFEMYKSFYHPIARQAISKIVNKNIR